MKDKRIENHPGTFSHQSRAVSGAEIPGRYAPALTLNKQTMQLKRLLQITMATIAALGTLLLSMGQRDLVLPLVMILAAGASVWLTDVIGILRLNRTVANIAMLLVVAISMRELIMYRGEIQAIGFARLLIYLQIIVLFQKKDARSYWLLVMLSLLQVIVAALFSQGIVFGAMLIIYMLIASLGLTLLLFLRRWEEFLPVENPAPASAPGRWPLAGQKSDFTRASAGGIDLGLGRELYSRLAGVGVRTIGVTVLLFIFLPRFGQVGWMGEIMGNKKTVGFTSQVNLGEFGQVIENPGEVMRIRFFDHATDAPYEVHGPIYLRGAVLMNYKRGQWRVGQPADTLGTQTLERNRHESLPANLVRQECIIEGLDRPELFYVAPYVPVNSDIYITVDESQLRLLRSENLRGQRFRYQIGTTALVKGRQQFLTPIARGENYDAALRIAQPDGENGLPNLARLAQSWIDESKLPQEDRAGRARYLERKLALSGMFKYSLESQNRDPAIDPIEDFVTKHRAGHCEYFATARTLRLRSQRIPARMVVGYCTDEWNEIGQCYQVRQLHSHTWVECYLRPGQIPRELVHGEDVWNWSKFGGWLQLDPTPEGRASSQAGWWSPIGNAIQWFDYAWSYYVVELNYERQRNAIFRPIAQAFTFLYKSVFNTQTWRNLYKHIGDALHLSGLPGAIAWGLLVAASLVSAALLGFLCWLARRLGEKLWRRLSGRCPKHRDGPRVEVEFYRRLEGLLAARGLVRSAGQTQREFACWAGCSLAAVCGETGLALLPVRVAEAFYRVRFGRLPLDNAQAEAVEQSLARIAACDAPRA
jgi:transglutaminase-like putative cysteine protease